MSDWFKEQRKSQEERRRPARMVNRRVVHDPFSQDRNEFDEHFRRVSRLAGIGAVVWVVLMLALAAAIVTGCVIAWRHFA